MGRTTPTSRLTPDQTWSRGWGCKNTHTHKNQTKNPEVTDKQNSPYQVFKVSVNRNSRIHEITDFNLIAGVSPWSIRFYKATYGFSQLPPKRRELWLAGDIFKLLLLLMLLLHEAPPINIFTQDQRTKAVSQTAPRWPCGPLKQSAWRMLLTLSHCFKCPWRRRS